MNINLHIERLSIEGIPFPHQQKLMLQDAVATELKRLLAIDVMSRNLLSGGVIPKVFAGKIQLSSENNPIHLGRQIAQSLYVGI